MRLIDADALLRNTVYNTLSAPYITKRDVEEAPTVDAVPVVHGRWIDDAWIIEDDRWIVNHHAIVCSACRYDIYKGAKTNYCPHCGAQMDGGDDDAEQ